jgi:opacity protein-like surface antigen
MRYLACFAVLASYSLVAMDSPPAQADGTEWSGPYVGADFGWISGSASNDREDAQLQQLAGFNLASEQMSDPIGGVHAGYNFGLNNRYIVGLEGDFDWTDTSEGLAASNLIPTSSNVFCPQSNTCITQTYSLSDDRSSLRELDWLSSFRGRAGALLQPDLLVYATGGVAFAQASVSSSVAQIETQTSSCSGPICAPGDTYNDVNSNIHHFSDTRTLVGYALGGGAEFKFRKSISARVEYLYYGFGEQDFGLFPTAPTKVDIHENVLRLGLSYYLN